MPHYPINTILPNNHTPIYATLPYQYQTAQQPYPHLYHTTLSVPYCPITIPSSMPHYPINTILPNNHTPIYATLPYQYHTAQQPYPHLCHTTLSIPDCPTTIPHLCHTTLSIPDCTTTIPPSMPHYPINTRLPNNHTLIYATLPYQYQTAQHLYPHLCHTTLSIPDCPTTIPTSMPHYSINTRLPNNHTLIYATLPYQYHTAQQPYPHLCHTTLSIPDCPTTIPPSMPHYPINTRLPNNHTLIYATLPYQYQTAQQPYPHLCHTTLSVPHCPTTIPSSMPHYPINTRLPNNYTPIYATLPYQYQTAQQPYPHLCHTTLSIPDCPTTIPPSMPHYPINTRLPNNHTLIYATLPCQYQTAQQPYPIYATLPYQYHTAQ